MVRNRKRNHFTKVFVCKVVTEVAAFISGFYRQLKEFRAETYQKFNIFFRFLMSSHHSTADGSTVLSEMGAGHGLTGVATTIVQQTQCSVRWAPGAG